MAFPLLRLKASVGRGCYGFSDPVPELASPIAASPLRGAFSRCFIWVRRTKLEQSPVKYLGLSSTPAVWGSCRDIHPVCFMSAPTTQAPAIPTPPPHRSLTTGSQDLGPQ